MQAYGIAEAQFHSYYFGSRCRSNHLHALATLTFGKRSRTTEEVVRWAPRTLIDGFENRNISFICIFHCVFSNNNEVENTIYIYIHTHTYIYIYIYIYIYTHTYRCPRRNVPDFGRVFLMLKYTDITQNTYIQS